MVGLAVAIAWVVQAQTLQPARFVVPKASEVTWNPDEKYLGHLFRNSAGHVDQIGIYDVVNDRGKVLLSPAADQDTEQIEWLAGRPVELVSTVEPVSGRDKPTIVRAVWALDGSDMTAKKLWAREYGKDEETSLSIDASPSLTHALVTLNSKMGTSYFVVTLGAGGMVFSPDATQATKKGHSFVGWSVDGTAMFGNAAANPNQFSQLLLQALNERAQVRLDGQDNLTFKINFVLSARPKSNAEIGSPIYELMPSNGALRQIRFRGDWPDDPPVVRKNNLVPHDEKLTFKQSTGGAKSLWLAPNIKNPQEGELVAAQAEEGWLAPHGGTVAFTVNGVLFVRRVAPPN